MTEDAGNRLKRSQQGRQFGGQRGHEFGIRAAYLLLHQPVVEFGFGYSRTPLVEAALRQGILIPFDRVATGMANLSFKTSLKMLSQVERGGSLGAIRIVDVKCRV